jgi:hypothetical protein
MASRLSHAQREALERQDARLLPAPLPMSPDQNALLPHMRHIARALKDRQTASPSSRALSHLTTLYDRSLPDAEVKRLACRRGCGHCCHQQVLVFAPELFFLAAQIRDREGMAESLRQQTGAAAKCPLLQNETCSAYAARPLNCHAFASVDVNTCISTFRYFSPQKILSPAIYGDLRDSCHAILLVAMQALDLPVHDYELNAHALATVLAQDHAEKRWLRGENILATVNTIPTGIPPDLQARIDRMATEVRLAL